MRAETGTGGHVEGGGPFRKVRGWNVKGGERRSKLIIRVEVW